MSRSPVIRLLGAAIVLTALVACGDSDKGPASAGSSTPDTETSPSNEANANAKDDRTDRGTTTPTADAAEVAIDSARIADRPIPELTEDQIARVRELVEVLGNRGAAERFEAEAELETIGLGALPILAEYYRDDSEFRRLHVVRLLGRTGHARAVRYLRDALKDPWLAVRIAAAESFETMLAPDDEFTMTELISVIKNDSEPIVTAHAAGALLAAGNLMGVPTLVANLEKKLWPREISFEYLVELTGETFDFEPYANKTVRFQGIERWKEWLRGYTPLHENLVANLGVYKFLFAETAKQNLISIGVDAFDSVLDGLDAENEHIRAHCAEILGLYGDPRAVDALESALTDVNPMVRLESAIALGKIGDAAAIPALREATDDDDRDVRISSIVALGKLCDPELERAAAKNVAFPEIADVARLFALFGPAPIADRGAAAAKLIDDGNPLAYPWIVAMRDTLPEARKLAARGRSAGAEPPAIDADDAAWDAWLASTLVAHADAVRTRLSQIKRLVVELEGDDAVLSWARRMTTAYRALLDSPASTEHERFLVVDLTGRIRDRAAAPAVAERLTVDASIMVREAAARALAVIAEPSIRESLEHALGDDERYVVVASIRALASCGNLDSIDPLMATRDAHLTDSEIVDEISKTVLAIHDRAGTSSTAE